VPPGLSFGHGARHLAGTGLSAAAVQAAITEAIRQIQRSSVIVRDFWGRVTVAGRVVEYRARNNGGQGIHVGTYYPK
jgi:hypothetical protein